MHEVRCFVGNRYFAIYAAAVVILLTALDAHDYQSAGVPPFGMLIVWSICVIHYVVIYVLLGNLWSALTLGWPRTRIFRPVSSALTMALTSVVTVSLVIRLTDAPGGLDDVLDRVGSNLVFNLFLSQVFETLFFLFVLPLIDARLQLGLYQAPAEPRARSIVLSGRRIPVTELLYANAQEHYISIRLRDETLTLRARIGDLVSQLGTDDGVQPHRSWWVAHAAVAELRRKPRGDVLCLTDGTEIRVARQRRDAIRGILDCPSRGAA